MTDLRELHGHCLRIQGRVAGIEANLTDLVQHLTDGLDGQRGTAYDTSTAHSNAISDPTGNSIGTPNDAARDLDDIQRLLAEMDERARHLDNIRRRWIGPIDATTNRPIPHVAVTATTLDDVEWCRCCWRDDQHCEPVVQHYIKMGFCRWCGDFRSTHKLGFDSDGKAAMPPLELVVKWHRYGKRSITAKDVTNALRNARAQKAGTTT